MGAITWSLVFTLAWLALAVFLLSGCTQVPRDLQAIHSATLARVPYSHYARKDFTYVPVDRVEEGNCAKQAFTSYIDLRQAGYRDAQIILCRIPGGEGHAYTAVNGFALDGRYGGVLPVAEEDCR